jgi:hypothetical protein
MEEFHPPRTLLFISTHIAKCCSRLPILRTFGTLPAVCQLQLKNFILQELLCPSLPFCQLLFQIANHKNFQNTSRTLSSAMEEFHPPRTLLFISTHTAKCCSRLPILRAFSTLPALCHGRISFSKNSSLYLCHPASCCSRLPVLRAFSTLPALCQLPWKNSILQELFSPSPPLLPAASQEYQSYELLVHFPLSVSCHGKIPSPPELFIPSCQLLFKNTSLQETFSPSLPLCHADAEHDAMIHP